MARKPKQASAKKTTAMKMDETLSSEAVVGDKVVDDDALTIEQSIIASRCGSVLREARKAQNLSISEVANQLRLSGVQVEALEADDYANLPEPMIVKGFIRNYAKLLKTSAEPLLNAYSVMVPSTKQHSLILESTANMTFSEPKRIQFKYYVFTALAIILAFGAWVFYQSYIQKPNSVVASDALSNNVSKGLLQTDVPSVERAKDEASSQLEGDLGARAASIETPLDIAVEGVDAVTNETIKSATGNTSEVATEVVQQNNSALLDYELAEKKPLPNGKSRLELDVTQETWVSVVNASGREIYNKTLFAGNHEVIDVWPPVKLVVGNAHGAMLSVNGEVTDLAPHTRINVARISIN